MSDSGNIAHDKYVSARERQRAFQDTACSWPGVFDKEARSPLFSKAWAQLCEGPGGPRWKASWVVLLPPEGSHSQLCPSTSSLSSPTFTCPLLPLQPVYIPFYR